jgi:hypothetical protein
MSGTPDLAGMVSTLITLIPGWKTSEAKLTAVVGGLYAIAQAAEGLGLLHVGTVAGLWPVAALAAVYTLGRTWLKAKVSVPLPIINMGKLPSAPAQDGDGAAQARPEVPASPDLAPLVAMVSQAVQGAQAQAVADVQAKVQTALGVPS